MPRCASGGGKTDNTELKKEETGVVVVRDVLIL